MNHLCFIVDNSLTMDQCPNNGITLLDSVKSSIENTLRNLSRLGFPNNHEHIHLFCTSNPKFYLSSFEHDESHLYCQLKLMKSSLETDPSLTIQTAIDHISKFRILSQAETFKGYREAFIFEPALILFFSDRMTKKKIQNIVSSIDQGKFQIRSEYQFASFLISPPSFTERNLLTEQAFKNSLEGQKDIKTLGDAIRKANGELKFVVNVDSLNVSLWSRIETFKPFLFCNFQLKEIKKKTNQLVPSERGAAYFKAWQQYLSNIPFQLVPNKLWKIPLPFSTKCAEERGELKVQKMGQLRFFLDLTKKYNEFNSNLLPENKYKVIPNPALAMLEGEKLQEKFPIFFQYKNAQCIIGLLCISAKGSQINFYFGNFPALNQILKPIQTKQIARSPQSAYAYLATIPYFYLKFLKIIFDKLCIGIDYDLFENPLINTPNLAAQLKLQSIRAVEKINLPRLFQINVDSHQNNLSQCCSIYSQDYDAVCQRTSKQQLMYSPLQTYYSQLLGDLLTFKKKIGINDYLTSSLLESIPVVRQLQKYNNVKKIGEDDFNENITINLGNPYKKKRKTNESELVKQPNNKITNSQSSVKETKKDQQKQIQNSMIDEKEQTIQNQSKFGVQSAATSRKSQRLQQKQAKAVKTPVIKHLIKEISLDNQSIRRINNLSSEKSIDLRFNGINLATDKMLRNESIIQIFYDKMRRS